MAYTAIILVQLGSTDTGLTLSAKLYDSSNVQQGSTITTGFTELGNGEYQWVVSLDDSFRGTARFYSGGSTYQTSLPINGSLYYLVAIKGRTDLIGSAEVEFSNPLVQEQSFTIVRGDDYSSALGNMPTYTNEDWPDLTGATVEFRCKHRYTGTYIDPIECEASGTTIAIPLPTEVTEDLAIGTDAYLFDVQATLPDGKVTLINGTMTVQEDVVDA